MISARANINPDLLTWARQTVGLDIEKSAKKIAIDPKLLEQWESGEKKPTINQLRKAANAYKRSLAVFFLSDPPSLPNISMDFRLLPENMDHELSYDTLVQIRQCNRRQEIAIELAKMINLETGNELSIAHLNDDPEKLAQRERDFLNINIQNQFKLKDKYAALRFWKKTLEDKGILVFQSSKVQISEMRGYSGYNEEYPFIIINSKDTPTARIFSLFHEYCHLLLRNGGICDMYESDYKNNISRFEVFCNHFAAAFLVPKAGLLKEPLVKQNLDPDQWSDENIRKLANKYKVSREVIIRRLTTLDLVTLEFYRTKRKQLLEELKLMKSPDEDVKIPYYRKVLSWNGEMYSNLVLESYREQKINMSDVADYLGVRLKHLPKIESELMRSEMSS
ncbi:MAG: ImmA/IrrE family metallo-endopeptidase [Methanosarcinales archaeon]|nr:ImmA/IrrE family metallo-endopeptidase [Methanosarcinales archaeon]